ncbi:MAG: 4-(cytidine 5'-diphospho)-2-C-methyl-D-erythritol kinase [Hyphomicrobiaceae bacterium]
MAAPIDEQAPAKVNLSLRVLGRRPDGYHELESLVVFAAFGDRLTLHPGEAFALTMTGPFAAALTSDNLVATAVRRAQLADPHLRIGAFHLEKNLPVAAGLGGGSSDAAAALRALRRANPGSAMAFDWTALAAGLGADVSACLSGRPALMRGIGERLDFVARLPEAAMVLVNPRLPLGAGDVFRALGAEPLRASAVSHAPPPAFAGFHDLVAYLQSSANDLETPAKALCPEIVRVEAALASQPAARLVRMSGSGPTCFALFASLTEADAAAAVIARHESGWWVRAMEVATV